MSDHLPKLLSAQTIAYLCKLLHVPDQITKYMPELVNTYPCYWISVQINAYLSKLLLIPAQITEYLPKLSET